MIFRVITLLLPLLVVICHANGEPLDVQINYPYENTGKLSPISLEDYHNITTRLCDTKIELAIVYERNKALQTKLESEKLSHDGQIEMLKLREKMEKQAIQQTCDLKIRELEMNATLSSKCCSKLEEVEKNTNKDVETFERHTSSAILQNLLKLSTGYYYISSADQKENWYNAGKWCRAQGLALASVETKEENDVLLEAIANFKNDAFWLSGTDQGSDGSFYWSSTGQPLGLFKYWSKGQPDNYKESEHCLHFWTSSHLWNDISCNLIYRFICELM